MIFTLISFIREKYHTAGISPKVQKVHFPSSCYHKNNARHISIKYTQYIRSSCFFFVIFKVFAAPFWFTGLQLKQFALHKCYDKTLWIYRSLFSVCTVPNSRNTRRSTALGETPLIWYCARDPEPSNPFADPVSVGCGCGTQRGSVHVSYTQCHFLWQFAACQVQQLHLPSCRVFPTVLGNWWSGENPSFKKG